MTAYLLLGGTGFIGTNLALKLIAESGNAVAVACRHPERALHLSDVPGIALHRAEFDETCDFQSLVAGIDVVVHMVSTTLPATSNKCVSKELSDIGTTALLLDSCVASGVKKVVFLSSGGTVYGKGVPPFTENDQVFPISSYGLQKVAIEKLLHLYWHLYGLDYRIVRPSNPFGRFQNPDRGQGVIAAFVSAALRGDDLAIFGDGSVVRDFIYIDDLVEGLCRIIEYGGSCRVFNLGSGRGMSVLDVARSVMSCIPGKSAVRFEKGRGVDVPECILSMERFNEELGELKLTDFQEGVTRTARYQESILAK